MPASTDLGIQPEVTGRATLTMASRHGASAIGSSTHEKATRGHGSVMGPLRELLAIDHRQMLEAFRSHVL
jgi:hypothetical protein